LPAAIAKARLCSVVQVNAAIDRWADQAITDKAHKYGLALELARLEELQEGFYQRALAGNVSCGLSRPKSPSAVV
jgi:hypothetical protein